MTSDIELRSSSEATRRHRLVRLIAWWSLLKQFHKSDWAMLVKANLSILLALVSLSGCTVYVRELPPDYAPPAQPTTIYVPYAVPARPNLQRPARPAYRCHFVLHADGTARAVCRGARR